MESDWLVCFYDPRLQFQIVQQPLMFFFFLYILCAHSPQPPACVSRTRSSPRRVSVRGSAHRTRASRTTTWPTRTLGPRAAAKPTEERERGRGRGVGRRLLTFERSEMEETLFFFSPHSSNNGEALNYLNKPLFLLFM